MPPRRPVAELDAERFMKRVEDRIDQSFTLILEELEKIKLDVRKGNMQSELQGARLADLEMQVIETREQMQKNKRQNEATQATVAGSALSTATALADTTRATASALAASPGEVWKTRFGRVTAISAAFVAVVAIFSNLPKFARGTAEVVSSAWHYLVTHR